MDRLKAKALSIREVARLAETSTATVSRVLSGKDNVRPELHSRVMRVVRETGFVLDPAASRLARARGEERLKHRTVALVFCGLGPHHSLNYIRQQIMEGALDSSAGLGVTILSCRLSHEEIDERHVPDTLAHIPVDGLLVHPSRGRDHDWLRQIAPTVLCGSRPREHCETPIVDADNAAGMSALVRHMVDMGHRRLTLLSNGLEHMPFIERAEAFERTVAELGIEGTIIPNAPQEATDYAEEYAALPTSQRPTGLLTSSDGLAMSLLQEFHACGIRVPQDVSVAGFDGYAWGEDVTPRLTSWRPDWQGMAREGLEMLMAFCRGESVADRVAVGGELVVRDSVAPPPHGD